MTENTESLCRRMISLYGGYVKVIVVNRIGAVASAEDVEDCVSDVFAEICRSPDRIPESSEEAKAMIAAIAKRRAIDCFRRLKYHSSNLADDDGLLTAAAEDDTEDEVAKRDMKRSLWNAVEQLGEPDSSIIVYQYFYRKKVREIAEMLSMTTAAVNKRSQRAREKIRETLIKQGY